MENTVINALNAPKDCDIISFEDDPLTFEKEHIYTGVFEKDDTQFTITPETLSHFATETNRYIADGNQCNLPTRHTEDSEANRGRHERWYVKRDSKGRAGLFSILKFRDAEAAKIAKTSQTSIYCPPTHKVNGKEYVRPILHTALTDYPAVPGLDGFTPIAASLVDPEKKKGDIMPLKDLAVKLGLQLSAEQTTDEAIQKAIALQFTSVTDMKKASDDKLTAVTLELDNYKKLNPPKADPVKVSKAQIGMLKENRELKLSALVEKGRILPVVKKQLEAIFCDEGTLTLCLSQDADDSFNRVVEALKENDPIKLAEVTGAQTGDAATLSLSAETNPVIAAAEKTAARMRAQMGSAR